MKNLTPILAALGFSFLFYFGCASKVKITETAQIGEIKKLTTGFLMAYTFSVEDFAVGENGCVLELKNAEDRSHINVDVKLGKNDILVETKPGVYYFHDLNCGRHVWNLNTNRLQRFKVVENKISLIVPSVFKVSDRFRIYFNFYNRQVTQERALTLWGSLSDQSKTNLISGYTLAPITLELIEGTHSWDLTEVSKDGVSFKKLKRSQFKSLKSCYRSEEVINGLKLGRIDVNISYEVPVKIDMGNLPNSFSNQFIECVRSEISRFDNNENKYKKIHLVL